MKKQSLKLLGLIILFVIPMSLMAQQRGQGRNQGDRAARQKQQMEELKKTLSLKKDQTKKFDEIYKSFNDKQQKLMESMRSGGDRTSMREKMDKLTKERDDSLKKILDKDQIKKYEAYLKKQAEQRAQRGNRGGDGRR